MLGFSPGGVTLTAKIYTLHYRCRHPENGDLRECRSAPPGPQPGWRRWAARYV